MIRGSPGGSVATLLADRLISPAPAGAKECSLSICDVYKDQGGSHRLGYVAPTGLEEGSHPIRFSLANEAKLSAT
ncbi:hypothetical protein llg_09490 [Luteolibacter sp. LG18]|nr:hypothetical protein llg_09490 [Luteolibacter sp. LG18]